VHDVEAVEWIDAYVSYHTDRNGLLPGVPGFLGDEDIIPTSQALAEEAQRRWIDKFQSNSVHSFPYPRGKAPRGFGQPPYGIKGMRGWRNKLPGTSEILQAFLAH
jgi:hypothetical protein